MKRKLFAASLAAIMALILCACGGNSSSPEPPTSDNPPASVQGPNNDSTGPAASDPLIDAAPTDGVTDTANSVPTDTQAQEQQPAAPETTSPTGLIIMTVEASGNTDFNHVFIASIDPVTGTSQSVSTFSYGQYGTNCYITPNGSGASIGKGYYATRREWFSENYDRMAISWQDLTTAETHAGWIDSEGTFFDVTVALGMQAKSDFDDLVRHEAIGFTEDDEFIYKALVGEGANAYWEYYFVPLDDLTASAINSGLPLPGEGEDYRSSDVRISDYGASETYLTNERDTVSLLHDASGNVSTYVPGTSRLSWNGVFSPDETFVAFMSKPKNGGTVDIYTMSLAGGDPVKVDIGQRVLAPQLDCEKGYYVGGAPCAMLIDWK